MDTLSTNFMNSSLITNTAEVLKTIDHAAAMNDRWLFLAAISLLVLLCVVVIRWLAGQLRQIIQTQNELTLRLAARGERCARARRPPRTKN